MHGVPIDWILIGSWCRSGAA